jgi:hypothetical protein
MASPRNYSSVHSAMFMALYGENKLPAIDSNVLDSEPAAWRVNDWRRKVPISRSKFYEERNAGRIKTVKVGSSTLVTTTPKDYLAALAA